MNMKDMVSKGRHMGNRKINEDDVREIRRLSNSGMCSVSLSEKFQLHEKHIQAICRGAFWPHVGGMINKRRLITEELKNDVITNLRKGFSRKECQGIFNLSKASIQKIAQENSTCQ